MNCLINENRIWYCEISDNTIGNISRLRHFNLKSRNHKKQHDTVVTERVFQTISGEVNYVFNDTTKDCKNKYFLSCEYLCVYDVKLTIMEKKWRSYFNN